MTIEMTVTKEELNLVLFALKALENETTIGLNKLHYPGIKVGELTTIRDDRVYAMRKVLKNRITGIHDLTYYLRAKGDC